VPRVRIMAEENQEEITANEPAGDEQLAAAEVKAEAATGNGAAAADGKKRPHRSQKVGVITSDKMQQTVVVRVDRLVRHTKYRRYVRRTSKFMAHDEMGATIGDKVRIVETRPMSARKRWRVIEIVQKAAK